MLCFQKRQSIKLGAILQAGNIIYPQTPSDLPKNRKLARLVLGMLDLFGYLVFIQLPTNFDSFITLIIVKIIFHFSLLACFLLCFQTSGWSQKLCLNFDGVDDYVEVPNTSLNNIGFSDFTFEAWIKGDLANQPAHPMIFSNRSAVGTGVLFFFHDLWGSSNYKMLALQINQNANHYLLNNGTFNGNILDGTCHHIAIAREIDSLYYYVDGSLIGKAKIFNSSPTVSSTADLWIGQDGPTNNSFAGIISRVRIWDVARSASEISNNMNAIISGLTPGLAAYWELDDGSGQIAMDKTTNYDGQLGSSAGVDGNDPQWIRDCCSFTTGISGAQPQRMELTLSPNPNNGQFAIDLAKMNLASNGTEVRVFDLNGKNVFKENIAIDKVFIDISAHPAGIYLIQVITSEVLVTQKFIKH